MTYNVFGGTLNLTELDLHFNIEYKSFTADLVVLIGVVLLVVFVVVEISDVVVVVPARNC